MNDEIRYFLNLAHNSEPDQDVVAVRAEAAQRGAEPDERRGEGHLGGRAPVQVRQLLDEEPEALLGRVGGAASRMEFNSPLATRSAVRSSMV